MKASTLLLLPIAVTSAVLVPVVDHVPTAEDNEKTPTRLGRVWGWKGLAPTPGSLDKRQRNHRQNAQQQRQQSQRQQQQTSDVEFGHPGLHTDGGLPGRRSVIVPGNGTANGTDSAAPHKGPPIRPQRPAGESIPDEKVAEEFMALIDIVKTINKHATGFGNEGSGMRPDRQRIASFKAIEQGFRDWIKTMKYLQDRMLGTREWHIPAQMTVAHIYYDYTKHVKKMFKELGTHTKQFDVASHMRCEVASLIAEAFIEYRYLADDLYTKNKKDKKHTGGRLLRAKFFRPLPSTWEPTRHDPAPRESIPDWVRKNDWPNEPDHGTFVEGLRHWASNSFAITKCSEMEPHGTY